MAGSDSLDTGFTLGGIVIVACCIFGCSGWWYASRPACQQMISLGWQGEPQTCQQFYNSGYQPCFIEDTRRSAYCLQDRGQYGQEYKVFEVTLDDKNDLILLGGYQERDLVLFCSKSNPLCSFWHW